VITTNPMIVLPKKTHSFTTPKPSPIALKALIHGTFNPLKFAVTQSVDIHADHNRPVIRTADATISCSIRLSAIRKRIMPKSSAVTARTE